MSYMDMQPPDNPNPTAEDYIAELEAKIIALSKKVSEQELEFYSYLEANADRLKSMSAVEAKLAASQAQVRSLREVLESVDFAINPAYHEHANCNCEPDTGYVCQLCRYAASSPYKIIISALSTTSDTSTIKDIEARVLEEAANHFDSYNFPDAYKVGAKLRRMAKERREGK